MTGLGRTKRVVLYDTLLRRFSPAETGLVVAHELGHVHYQDVPRGLLYLALVAPAAMFAAARLGEALTPREVRPGTPAALPAAALALGIVSALVGTVSNQLSRRVEARADTYSLQLTHQPAAFIASERRLVEQNVAQTLELAQRAYVLENGAIVMQGSAAQIRDDPTLSRAYLGL